MITKILGELKVFAGELFAELVVDRESFISTCLFLLTFYMRENCTGPSVYTQYVQDTLAPLEKGGPLPKNNLDPISTKNTKLQGALLSHFEKDGE